MNRIICIGSSTKDVFFPINDGEIRETPEDLESQRKITFELGAKYQVSEGRHESVGGCAANVACGLARLGLKSYCYTRTGDDQSGAWIKKELEKNGVNLDLVQTGKNHRSDLSAIVSHIPSGERIVFSDRDSNEKLEINEAEIKKVGAECIFVSSLNGNGEESWDKKLDKILKLAAQEKMKLIFNPGQKNLKSNPQKIIETIGQAEVLMVNKDEAIEIVDKLNGFSEELLNKEEFLTGKLKEMGVKVVALTDGQRGAWGFDGKELVHVGVNNEKIIDSLGAGDAFSSGFMAAYIKGKDLQTCVQWGANNGGSVVMFYGATEGLLSEEKIVQK